MKINVLPMITMLALLGCSKPGAEEIFNKGVDAQKAEQYDEAIVSYLELIKTYPDSARTPEAYYAIGTIYQNQKKSYHQAIDFYKQLVNKYPHHATSPNAAFIIGFIYNNELKQYDSARTAYENYIKEYPADHLVNDAKFEMQNLGRTPEEIFADQERLAKEQAKQTRKPKK
jgi:TolA-binding protein